MSGDVVERPVRAVASVLGVVDGFVRGKSAAIELSLVCLLAEGHLLLDDVPGVGKTSLARSLASALGLSWKRIQFTPDVMPSDVTGVSIFHQGSSRFEFHPGPVFASVVLADEINRASPRTQSSLLEAMEERSVTVDGSTHALPSPFLVIATQNPVDMAGTYPLPEAQLDRFLMRMSLGYPEPAFEVEVLAAHHAGARVSDVPRVLDADGVAPLIAAAASVSVDPVLMEYMVRLVAATRTHPSVALGASPRGSIGLLRACRALALVRGRSFVQPGDVQELAVPVLAHRLVLRPDALGRGVRDADVISELVASVPAPQPV